MEKKSNFFDYEFWEIEETGFIKDMWGLRKLQLTDDGKQIVKTIIYKDRESESGSYQFWKESEDKKSLLGLCKSNNKKETIRANDNISKLKRDKLVYSNSSNLNKQIAYLQNVVVIFLTWMRENGFPDTIKSSEKIQLEQENKPSSTKHSVFPHGYLTQKIKEFAEADNCKEGESVKSYIIDRWIELLKNEGYPTSSNTTSGIRTILSRLGFSKEKIRK